ncbi:MAG TPA: insulinase family protein [Hungateiclostridium thermocellum]|uniref:Peptidase M16 domain protein n=2 Tax=Acetivibrio thermocellus TaxID=1515 RepID=A3DE39_ACET2|nr:pitrilysin family protein [Acetivibrio thermocellus]CDG35678.1 peptidase M16-like protein [Acetivibrio thermocellus BC1]ABN52218.1 peptidase M16 domain protein [Acetivibrio thermocellus ATCC 27405]ADU74295.1 peptidase M16 domain protein [Acetivibrio thermocellus DSM 1313]ALX08237.1 peptidase M16 domain protein [Acetivibrio thermocellus AD2]ANV75985.1 peptidase M16 domain protein [Acetivibrio thermocellus DSM 2360]
MDTVISENKVSEVASFNGIKIYTIKSKKFKTNSINIFFYDDLTRENATKNAMIPAVLRRGCEGYPTIRDISLYLEELYGSVFDCGVTKKGEHQIIQFYVEYISNKYAQPDIDLTKKNFDLLLNIITRPVLENNAFKKEYVEQEVQNLKELIESRVNDKMQYVIEKCLEEMCKDEPFGIYDYGSVEDLRGIDEKNLYEHYKYFLETLPVYVFISGDVDDEGIKYITDGLAKIKRGNVKSLAKTKVEVNTGEVRNIIERVSVNQGKLCLGFRTNTPPGSKDYYKLLVYNSILGGGLHSKLFQNVREKAGLAYYAFSRLEKFKGLMVVSCGIEIKNKDKALEIIYKQLDEIKNGNISDYEYEASIKSIETGIKSLKDSQLQIVDFYLSQYIAETDDTPDDVIENVKKVTKKDVVDIAERIKLDTVYFLTSKEE